MRDLTDTDRIAFLEGLHLEVEVDGACSPPWSVFARQAEHGPLPRQGLIGEGDTLRDAIDVAIEAAPATLAAIRAALTTETP